MPLDGFFSTRASVNITDHRTDRAQTQCSPQEVLAERTECWLTEKFGDEAVTLDLVHLVMSDGPPAPPDGLSPRIADP